jgi:hypothetical protein
MAWNASPADIDVPFLLGFARHDDLGIRQRVAKSLVRAGATVATDTSRDQPRDCAWHKN